MGGWPFCWLCPWHDNGIEAVNNGRLNGDLMVMDSGGGRRDGNWWTAMDGLTAMGRDGQLINDSGRWMAMDGRQLDGD